jgi:hypothetical protein
MMVRDLDAERFAQKRQEMILVHGAVTLQDFILNPISN